MASNQLPSRSTSEDDQNRSAGRARGRPPAAGRALARETLAYEQATARLLERFADVRRDLQQVRLAVSSVVETESSRRLTRDEARRVAQLRFEGQRLRYEMETIRAEVLRLSERRARGRAGN